MEAVKGSKPAKRFDSQEQEVFLNLWRTYDRLRVLEDELFGEFDLTAQQYNALRLLAAARPGKLKTLQVGARLVSRAPDVTRLLDKLADRGLVERERRAENRREVHVGITDAGLALLEKLSRCVRECHQRQLGHMQVEEKRTLIDLLKKARGPHELETSSWR